jgi:SagB-type dehydrogenase family enzyme
MTEFYRRPTVAALAEFFARRRPGAPAPQAKARTAEDEAAEAVKAFDLIYDPEERERFKDAEPGLRRDAGTAPAVELPAAGSDRAPAGAFARRRSHRRFLARPLELARLGGLLSCLRQVVLDGKPKYLYASAGGLYPVQTYLYVKPGRVSGLAGGAFYYRPVDHRLVPLALEAGLDREAYDPLVNRPIFDEAAFAVFLIAQLGAIAPMYGEDSLHYAVIEAGLICQLLETSAPDHGIGLCQIGRMDFERVRGLFALDRTHVLVHSLLGGPVGLDTTDRWESHPEPYPGAAGDAAGWEEGEI